MARDPQVVCSRETYGRLEKIRKESKMKWVDFLKLCGVSRSQWDCIRNSKPMGQAIYQRIAQNLKIEYIWLMEGKVEVIWPEYPQPVHDAGYPLPQENISDGGKELEGVKTVDSKGSAKSDSQKNAKSGKAVKVMEKYEYVDERREAKITIEKDAFCYCYVDGLEDEGQMETWTFDDWMFLGEVAQEIKRLVQG